MNDMNSVSRHAEPNLNFHRPMLIGLSVLIVLAGGSLIWSMTAKIAGAVIATGSVIVEGKPKTIQHLDGGSVAQIHISSGETVVRGQLLIQLDDTALKANLAIYEGRLREALVKKARLSAELEDNETFEVPHLQILAFKLGAYDVSQRQQKAMMAARRATLQAHLLGQDERFLQFQNQIAGVQGLIKAKRSQIAAYDEEIKAIATLVRNGISGWVRCPVTRCRDSIWTTILTLYCSICRQCDRRSRVRQRLGDGFICRAKIGVLCIKLRVMRVR